MDSREKRARTKPIQIMCTDAEHAAIHRRADELGVSLRALVVCSALGVAASPDGVIEKLLDLEMRMRALESGGILS